MVDIAKHVHIKRDAFVIDGQEIPFMITDEMKVIDMPDAFDGAGNAAPTSLVTVTFIADSFEVDPDARMTVTRHTE